MTEHGLAVQNLAYEGMMSYRPTVDEEEARAQTLSAGRNVNGQWAASLKTTSGYSSGPVRRTTEDVGHSSREGRGHRSREGRKHRNNNQARSHADNLSVMQPVGYVFLFGYRN
jgi:hypothetical protein